MVQQCSVHNCNSKLIKGNGIIFHGLPLHSPDLLEKWLEVLKIDYDWTSTKYYNICSKHFKEDDYRKSPSGTLLTDLLPNAVPSILLDDFKQTKCSKRRSDSTEHVSSKPLPKKVIKTIPGVTNKEFQHPTCFVPNCKAPKSLPLYKIPFTNKHLLNIWSKRIGLSTMYDLDLYVNITICKSHFHESCFDEGTMQLKHNAIPSLNLIDYSGPPDNCCLINSLYSEESSMMTSTGDHTWGWLGSTEHFGRDPEPNEFVVIPKSKLNDEKYVRSTQAVHCIIYAENDEKIFGIYNARAAILMQLRYDGYFGFPGGLMDDNEDTVTAVNREMVEEMNLNTTLHSVHHDDHVISHWSEKKKLTLHFYKLKITMAELIELEKCALIANDYGSEVLGTIRVPLYTLGDNHRGFPVFLKNKFVGCSRDQLLAALSSLNIMTPEEIQNALNV